MRTYIFSNPLDAGDWRIASGSTEDEARKVALKTKYQRFRYSTVRVSIPTSERREAAYAEGLPFPVPISVVKKQRRAAERAAQ